jgi:hypothetical protein
MLLGISSWNVSSMQGLLNSLRDFARSTASTTPRDGASGRSLEPGACAAPQCAGWITSAGARWSRMHRLRIPDAGSQCDEAKIVGLACVAALQHPQAAPIQAPNRAAAQPQALRELPLAQALLVPEYVENPKPLWEKRDAGPQKRQ